MGMKLPPELEAEILARADKVGPCAADPPKVHKKGVKQKSTEISAVVWKSFGIPDPVREHRFHPVRKWRLDFAWLDQKLALEVDGGIYGGRHTRGAGFKKDQEKRNAAILMGWRVLHTTPAEVKDGSIFGVVREALGLK